MRTQFQSAVIAVPEEGLAVNTKEFFCLFDRDPSVGCGHGVKKREPSYSIDPYGAVKVLNRFLGFVLWFYINEAKLK